MILILDKLSINSGYSEVIEILHYTTHNTNFQRK